METYCLPSKVVFKIMMNMPDGGITLHQLSKLSRLPYGSIYQKLKELKANDLIEIVNEGNNRRVIVLTDKGINYRNHILGIKALS